MDCLFRWVIIMQKADVYHDAFPHIILCVSFTLFVVFDVSSSYGASAGLLILVAGNGFSRHFINTKELLNNNDINKQLLDIKSKHNH